jgi:acyl-CoA dehydrogenase
MQNNYLSLPFFDKEHVLLSESLHRWCHANIDDEHADSEDLHDQCRSLARKLGEAGWLDYVVAEQYGGKYSSIDLRSVCLIREILASYSGLADFVFAMQGLGSASI